jgi:predicted RecA/RadA family phage recombinase
MTVQAQYLGPQDEFEGIAAADLNSGDIVFDALNRAGVMTAMAGVKTGGRFRATTTGRFRVKAKTTDTFDADASPRPIVYWDATNKEATSTASGNKAIGRASADKTNGQTTVDVLLNELGPTFNDTTGA